MKHLHKHAERMRNDYKHKECDRCDGEDKVLAEKKNEVEKAIEWCKTGGILCVEANSHVHVMHRIPSAL